MARKTNPVSVLMAMLGGGFEGYGKAENRREDTRRSDRDFGEKVRQFDTDTKAAGDRFRDTMNLNRDEFGHRRDFDWTSLGSRESEAALDRALRASEGDKDRTTQERTTNISVGGRRNNEVAEQTRQGNAYLVTMKDDPEFQNKVTSYLQANPEVPMGLAAYNVVTATQWPAESRIRGGVKPFGGGSPLDSAPPEPTAKAGYVIRDGKRYWRTAGGIETLIGPAPNP